MRNLDMIAILGPTACGKTTLAVALAAAIGGEVLSADSRQVYRGMDIGTGKDLDEYNYGGRIIPCHLIDMVEPGSKYNLFEYRRDFATAYRGLKERGRMPILCGGSGLYLEAALKGYSLPAVPENIPLRQQLNGKSLDELTSILAGYKRLHNTTDVDTPQRAIRAIEIEEYRAHHATLEESFPPISSLVIGVDVDRETRRARIEERLKARLNNGLVEEVKGLLGRGIPAENLIYYGLEYKYVTLYILGQLSFEQMQDELTIAIRQFAKRQMTWFRGMERRGFTIHWLAASLSTQEKVQQIITLVKQYGS